MRQLRFDLRVRAAVLILLATAFLAGCGGGSSMSQMTTATPNASVAGPYNVVLTSTAGNETTSIYANFTQTGGTFTGDANTLLCPSNSPAQCIHGSVSVNGTVSGTAVKVVVSFPSQAGTTTVNLVGSATGTGGLNGSYSDSLGGAGAWTATAAAIFPSVSNFTGTFNSTSRPLTIPPSISVNLNSQANFSFTGTASVGNWSCVTSLTLSGQAVGNALSLTDAANKVDIIALPSLPSGNSFNFSYKFEPTAASCPGDNGSGMLTITSSPWDY